MAKIEDAPRKLVLREGSTALTLDKDSGKATLSKNTAMEQKAGRVRAFRYRRHRREIGVDGLSGASIHHSVLHWRSGEIMVLTTEEAEDAAETVKKLRAFVGL
jgi:hypothetical protein